MKHNTRKGKQLTRRGILPIIGSALLVPFLGFGKSTEDEIIVGESNNDEYETLLKPDGTAVKVKISTLQNSKVIRKNISNKSFLNWLGRKL